MWCDGFRRSFCVGLLVRDIAKGETRTFQLTQECIHHVFQRIFDSGMCCAANNDLLCCVGALSYRVELHTPREYRLDAETYLLYSSQAKIVSVFEKNVQVRCQRRNAIRPHRNNRLFVVGAFELPSPPLSKYCSGRWRSMMCKSILRTIPLWM